MPWERTSLVNARHRFVLAALEADANLAELCRETGISRKTGYKWLARFRERGLVGLEEMSTRPRKSSLDASGEAVLRILELRNLHPRWGARKLRVVAARNLEAEQVPSERTVARILERSGEIRARRRPSVKYPPPKIAPVGKGSAPNELWTVDFKGWWKTKDGAKCEPLTVRDAFSRFVLKAQLMTETDSEAVRAEFDELFKRRGLPGAIQGNRSFNG
jgi:transposase InsO family protein